MFKKYQHLERFGTTEVENIEFGICHVFPKIDGTNASVWFENGEIHAGSRNRELSLDNDNGGFMLYATTCKELIYFFSKHPDLRLYGEWLIPHSLKTYRKEAWHRFYVFDVLDDIRDKYLTYDEYKPILDNFQIDYIPPICSINNGGYESFINQLVHNVFLIEDGKGTGEGIVIKNYDYTNKYGRVTWAKIVTSEFKEKHAKEMGGHVLNGEKLVEEDIAIKYTTLALCEKELSKIENECDGWSSKYIPRLLNTVYYCIVKEDCWEFVKEFKNPKIDFNTLKHFIFIEVKKRLPKYF